MPRLGLSSAGTKHPEINQDEVLHCIRLMMGQKMTLYLRPPQLRPRRSQRSRWAPGHRESLLRAWSEAQRGVPCGASRRGRPQPGPA